ncbi:hypothetical protein LguiA_007417 [Lonicera macranthoides]
MHLLYGLALQSPLRLSMLKASNFDQDMDNERGFDKVVRCQLSLATCYRLASQNKATTLEYIVVAAVCFLDTKTLNVGRCAREEIGFYGKVNEGNSIDNEQQALRSARIRKYRFCLNLLPSGLDAKLNPDYLLRLILEYQMNFLLSQKFTHVYDIYKDSVAPVMAKMAEILSLQKPIFTFPSDNDLKHMSWEKVPFSEMLRTFSTGLPAVCMFDYVCLILSGGQVVEDVLTFGLLTELMVLSSYTRKGPLVDQVAEKGCERKPSVSKHVPINGGLLVENRLMITAMRVDLHAQLSITCHAFNIKLKAERGHIRCPSRLSFGSALQHFSSHHNSPSPHHHLTTKPSTPIIIPSFPIGKQPTAELFSITNPSSSAAPSNISRPETSLLGQISCKTTIPAAVQGFWRNTSVSVTSHTATAPSITAHNAVLLQGPSLIFPYTAGPTGPGVKLTRGVLSRAILSHAPWRIEHRVNPGFVVGLFSTLMIDGLVLAVSGVGRAVRSYIRPQGARVYGRTVGECSTGKMQKSWKVLWRSKMEDHGCLKRAVRLLDGPIEEWGSTEGTVSWCSEEFLLSENEASVFFLLSKPVHAAASVLPVVGSLQSNISYCDAGWVPIIDTKLMESLVNLQIRPLEVDYKKVVGLDHVNLRVKLSRGVLSRAVLSHTPWRIEHRVDLDFVVGLFSTLMIDGLVLAVSGVGRAVRNQPWLVHPSSGSKRSQLWKWKQHLIGIFIFVLHTMLLKPAGSCSVCNSERNKMPIFKGFEGSALESGGWALSDLLKLLDTCGLSKRRLQIYSAARRKLQKNTVIGISYRIYFEGTARHSQRLILILFKESQKVRKQRHGRLVVGSGADAYSLLMSKVSAGKVSFNCCSSKAILPVVSRWQSNISSCDAEFPNRCKFAGSLVDLPVPVDFVRQELRMQCRCSNPSHVWDPAPHWGFHGVKPQTAKP